MGNWNINVQGVGPHHNRPGNDETDADKLAAEFVKTLEEKGHRIEHAEVTYGGKVDLLPQHDEEERRA